MKDINFQFKYSRSLKKQNGAQNSMKTNTSKNFLNLINKFEKLCSKTRFKIFKNVFRTSKHIEEEYF